MTIQSMFWPTNDTGHGPAAGYNEQRIREFFARNLVFDDTLQGPVRNFRDGLAVLGDTSPLAVQTGGGWISGLFFDSDAVENIAIATPGSDQGYRIFLRATWATQLVEIVAVAGVGSGFPTPTQNPGTVYEVSLCGFVIDSAGLIWTNAGKTVRGVTDERDYAQINLDVGAENYRPNSINDVPAGDRIIQMYRRQGGNSADWSFAGTNNYVPGRVRQQIGAITTLAAPANGLSVTTVTYPVPFSANPTVFLTLDEWGGPATEQYIVTVTNVFTTNFQIVLRNYQGFSATATVRWLAIGTE